MDNRRYVLTCCIAATLLSGTTFAAETQQDDDNSKVKNTSSNEDKDASSNLVSNDYSNILSEITVSGSYTADQQIDTATGLGLTLRETPQSVSVITQQRIEDQGMNTVKDAVANSVGLSYTSYDNVRNGFFSRGFDISNYQIDGVPVAWSLAGGKGETELDLSMYERIEVVRGATGLMTGVGDPSASINMVRKHADSTDLDGYIDVGVGSWNEKEITVDVSDALNKDGTIRGRLVAKHQQSDSYTDLYKEDTSVLYGVLEADVTNDTTVRVGGGYQHNSPTSPVWGGLPAFFSNGNLTNWDVSKTTATDWTEWDTTATNLFTNVTHTFDNGWQLKANYNYLKYESSSKLLYVSEYYGDYPDESTGLGLTAYPYKANGESTQNSVDFEVSGQYQWLGVEHDLMFGALYSRQSNNSLSYAPDLPAGNTTGYVDTNVNYYNWSGSSFAEPTWSSTGDTEEDLTTDQTGYFAATRLHVSENLKLVLGGRLSSWSRKGDYYDEAQDYGDNNVFVPYGGVLYDLTPEQRVYASYTEIFKPQDYQNAEGDYLDPLTGKSYEVGLKSAYLNNALQTSIAVYRIEQDNLAEDTGSLISGTSTEAYNSIQGTVSTGFEVEVTGQVTKGMKLGTGYSQFRAVDADGDKVNTDFPTKQFKLFGTYHFIDSIPALTVGAGVNWQNKIYATNTTYNKDVVQKSYALLNMMARYDINKHMHLQLNVNNITDEKYKNYVSSDAYRYGAPRNFKLSFKYTL